MRSYREDLERLACFAPGCRATHRHGEMYVHALCHVDAPCWVHYRADVLTVACALCGREVLAVVVASRASEALPPEGV